MEVALAILAVGLFFIGYFVRDIHTKLQDAIESLKTHYTPPEPDQPQSMLVEPLSPEQQAKKDFEERMKRINSNDVPNL